MKPVETSAVLKMKTLVRDLEFEVERPTPREELVADRMSHRGYC
jgi:hypothetical protein